MSLALGASDPEPASGVVSMRFRNGGSATWSDWRPSAGSAQWTLTGCAGEKTVYVRYRDEAGNVPRRAADRITFRP